MAYKFQVGPAILSGSVTHKELATFNSGLGANEENIVNVGSIRADSLQGDGNELDIVLADNQANALEIKEGSNVYQKFNTANGSESIEFSKPTDFNNEASVNMNIDTGDIASAVTVNKSPEVTLAGDLGGSATFTNLANATLTATIQADAVESGMLNDNVISGQTELAHADIVDADELMISDGGVLKKVGIDSLQNHYFGNVSGDATIADGGALTIAADSVEGTMLNTNAADGSTMELSSDSLSVLKVPNALTAGTGLSAAGTFDGAAARTLSIAAAQTSITSILNDSLKIGRGDGNDHIDFSTDDKIQFDIDNNAIMDVSDSGLNVSTGGIQLSAGGGGVIDVDSAKAIAIGENMGANNLTLGASNSTVVVAGNLTVQGTTTTVDSTTINISSSFTFEGPADAHETILSCGSPTQDLQVNLPQFSASAGAATYHLPVLADATTAASALVTAAEFALLDGASSIGTATLADSDGFLHNDNGTMKQTQVVKIAELAFSKISGDATVASNGALTIAAGAVEGSMVADDLISAQDNLGGTGVDQADEFLFSDAGTLKAITFSNLEDAIFGNVSGDIAIAAGGAATIQADAVESGMLNDNVISGQTELAAGGIADADELLISDGGVLKKIGVDNFRTYVNAGGTPTAFGDADATLAVGLNYASANTSAARTLTLPASAGVSVGQSIRVKVAGVSSGAVTIERAGSQTIDGNLTSVVLESDNSAIELVYVAADDWRIF